MWYEEDELLLLSIENDYRKVLPAGGNFKTLITIIPDAISPCYFTVANQQEIIKQTKIIALLTSPKKFSSIKKNKKNIPQAWIEITTTTVKKYFRVASTLENAELLDQLKDLYPYILQEAFSAHEKSSEPELWKGGPHNIYSKITKEEDRETYYRENYQPIREILLAKFVKFLQELKETHPFIDSINIVEFAAGRAETASLFAETARKLDYFVNIIAADRDAEVVDITEKSWLENNNFVSLKILKEQYNLAKSDKDKIRFVVEKSDMVNLSTDLKSTCRNYQLSLHNDKTLNIFVFCGGSTRMVVDGTLHAAIILQLLHQFKGVVFLTGVRELVLTNAMVKKIGCQVIFHENNHMILQLENNPQLSYSITEKILNTNPTFCDLQLSAYPLEIIAKLSSEVREKIKIIDLSYCSFGLSQKDLIEETLNELMKKFEKTINKNNFPNLQTIVYNNVIHEKHNEYCCIVDEITDWLQEFCKRQAITFDQDPGKFHTKITRTNIKTGEETEVIHPYEKNMSSHLVFNAR